MTPLVSGRWLAVTGTDTGVGKTIVASALLALARRRDFQAGCLKPLETGITAENARDSDASRLAMAAGHDRTLGTGSQDNDPPRSGAATYTFPAPLAPMVAARLAGETIDLAALDRACDDLKRGCTFGLIEGAGGLLVPITPTMSFADLFARWNLPLVCVAANRLGVINHTRLTVHAARTIGLEVRAIVLNEVGATDPSVTTNAATLAEVIPSVPVFTFPHMADPGDISALADAAEQRGLGRLLPSFSFIV